jgi:hypothetical protein
LKSGFINRFVGFDNGHSVVQKLNNLFCFKLLLMNYVASIFTISNTARQGSFYFELESITELSNVYICWAVKATAIATATAGQSKSKFYPHMLQTNSLLAA